MTQTHRVSLGSYEVKGIGFDDQIITFGLLEHDAVKCTSCAIPLYGKVQRPMIAKPKPIAMNDTAAGCAWCENPFIRRRGGSPQRFCSIHCRFRLSCRMLV